MKPYRTVALLLIGVILGSVGSLLFLHIKRIRAIRALPSLADRNHLPLIDELTSITLARRGEQLDLLTRDGMGGRHGTTRSELEAWLALERKFFGSDHDSIVAVSFEPGVTIEDLDSTLEYLHGVGVNRYFIGYSNYGKFIP